jgi:hypothetical protein
METALAHLNTQKAALEDSDRTDDQETARMPTPSSTGDAAAVRQHQAARARCRKLIKPLRDAWHVAAREVLSHEQ